MNTIDFLNSSPDPDEEERRISDLYFNVIKKVCDSDGLATGASLIENLFHLVATLAWSRVKAGQPTDKTQRWLLAKTFFNEGIENMHLSDFFMDHLFRFIPDIRFPEDFITFCRKKEEEMPSDVFLRPYQKTDKTLIVSLDTIKVCQIM